MKTIYSFILVLLHTIGYAQLGEPISFVDYTPLWNHSIIDSSEYDDPEFQGVMNLSSVIFFQETDSTAYIITGVIGDWLEEGSYIEKINTKTNQIIWHNKYNRNLFGAEENNLKAYVNDEGNLEMIDFRNIDLDNAYFFLLGDAQVSIKVYDGKTGELLSHNYQLEYEEHEIIQNDVNLNTAQAKIDGQNVIISNKVTSDKFWNKLNYYDSEAKLVKQDSFYREKAYRCYGLNKWYRIDKDLMMHSRWSTAQCKLDSFVRDSLDKFEYWVDMYANNFDTIVSYDLAEYIPYHFRINVRSPVGQAGTFLVHSQDSFVFDFLPRNIAYTMFDLDGNHMETIDLGYYEKKYSDVLKLYHEPGFLLVETEDLGTEKNISFYKTDGNGNRTFLKNLKVEDDRVFLRSQKIQLKEDNTVMYPYTVVTRDGIETLDRHLGIFAISGEDLGLMTGTEYYSSNKLGLLVYPNPSIDQLNVPWYKRLDGMAIIRDIIGNKIQQINITNDNSISIETAHLVQGNYIISIGTKDELSTVKFVKI